VSALNLFNITPKFSTCIVFVMFTDELFLGFETICSTLTGFWYDQEKMGYPALLIPLECCTINIQAADISCKAISLQLKEYISTEVQMAHSIPRHGYISSCFILSHYTEKWGSKNIFICYRCYDSLAKCSYPFYM
jgi:hypothetical protein